MFCAEEKTRRAYIRLIGALMRRMSEERLREVLEAVIKIENKRGAA